MIAASLYYGVRGYFGERRPMRARGRGRGLRPRMPYFDGPDASQQYYQYFKKLTEQEGRNQHCDRSHSRRRSYSRSHTRSRSRSRSRSRRRSYSRSRSRSRRSRSRRSRSRSRSRRSSSRSRRSKSYHSRSRSRKRSRSRSRRSRTKSRSKSRHRTSSPKQTNEHKGRTSEDGNQLATPQITRERSKSWSLPKDEEPRKSWSKSPKNV